MACHPRVCMRMRITKYCIVEVLLLLLLLFNGQKCNYNKLYYN